MSTNGIQGKVNCYDMAICIATTEINKAMKNVFDTTEDLPKKWYRAQVVDEDDSGNVINKYYYDPQAYEDSRDAASCILDVELAAPTVNFTSEMKDGIVLNISIASGSFQDGIFSNGNIYKKVYPLKDAIFSIDTAVTNIAHQAAEGKTVDEDFTVQFLYADLENRNLMPKIMEDSVSVPMPDSSMISLGEIMTDMCQDPKYTDKYIVGATTLPTVEATCGDFAPVTIKASMYQDEKDKTVGSLNYNIMTATSDSDFPTDAKAGSFSENPIPDNIPGVLYISYEKIIMDIIIKQTFGAFALSSNDFQFTDDAPATASLKSNVHWNQKTNIHCGGEYTEAKVYPDTKNKRIRADFTLDNVQDAEILKQHILKVQWSSYFTFFVDETGALKMSYSQDENPVCTDQSNWAERITLDIMSLGLNEITYWSEGNSADDQIKASLSAAKTLVVEDILDAVELPGKSTFTYDSKAEVAFTDLGLRINLQYK